MSEQARMIEHEAIPQRAQGIFYDKGFFSEALVYHDDEALYFELRGENSSVVRLPYEVLETLGEVIEEQDAQSSTVGS